MLPPRSLPWSPLEPVTCSSTATPDLPLSNAVSLSTQGLGLCPLRDPYLSQLMTQIRSAASLGPEGKRLMVMEKARAQGVSEQACKCACILGDGHPSETRVLGILIFKSTPLVVQMGRLKPQKKGTSQGSYSWLVTAETLTWGSGPLGLSSSSVSYCSYCRSFLEKELRNKDANVSRAQTGW